MLLASMMLLLMMIIFIHIHSIYTYVIHRIHLIVVVVVVVVVVFFQLTDSDETIKYVGHSLGPDLTIGKTRSKTHRRRWR